MHADLSPALPPSTDPLPAPQEPADPLLTDQLNALRTKLGRLPTVNEACDEIARDRTVISRTLRVLRLDVERSERENIETLRTDVTALLSVTEELRHAVQRQGAAIADQARLIEAAREASWRHRRDAVNARLALAVLARIVKVPESDAQRYGEHLRAIKGGHFAPIHRGLMDGQDLAILARLGASGSVVSALEGITEEERKLSGPGQVTPRARTVPQQPTVAIQGELR